MEYNLTPAPVRRSYTGEGKGRASGLAYSVARDAPSPGRVDGGGRSVVGRVRDAEVGGERHRVASVAGLWPQLEDLVPPELPPDVAVARLVALARSLLIENRQLREALQADIAADESAPDLAATLRATEGGEAA